MVRSRDPALDGLRTLAVMAVLVFHVLPSALPGGFWGVDLFFVLSGFLITRLLLDEQQARGSIALGYFYLRRLLRLGPALLLMLLGHGLLVALGRPEALPRLPAELAWALSYSGNWARAFELMPGPELGHLWSLAVEEQFYLLGPLLLMLGLRGGAVGQAGLHTARMRRLAVVALGLVLLGMAWRLHLQAQDASVARLYNGLDTRADTLLLGGGWALAQRAWPAWVQHRPAAWIQGLAGVALVMALLFSAWDRPWVYQVGIPAVALASLVLIQAALAGGALQNLLSHPAMVQMGRWSYGIYLWHFPWLLFGLAQGWQGLGLLAAVAVPSVVCAGLSFHGVEQPILRRWAGAIA